MKKIEVIVRITDDDGVVNTIFEMDTVDIQQARDLEKIYNDDGSIQAFVGKDTDIVISGSIKRKYDN